MKIATYGCRFFKAGVTVNADNAYKTMLFEVYLEIGQCRNAITIPRKNQS